MPEEANNNTLEWLAEFHREFIEKIETVDADFFTNLGLVKSDFDYLLNVKSDSLLVKIIDCAQYRPSYFDIDDADELATVVIGLTIAYTAGLKDTLV